MFTPRIPPFQRVEGWNRENIHGASAGTGAGLEGEVDEKGGYPFQEVEGRDAVPSHTAFTYVQRKPLVKSHPKYERSMLLHLLEGVRTGAASFVQSPSTDYCGGQLSKGCWGTWQ